MKWVYGSFQSQPGDNFAYAGGSRTAVYKNGQLTSVLTTVDYTFTIHADGQLALAARMQQIKNAIRLNGFNVGFLHDDGSPSHYYLDSSQSRSGVRITKFPFALPEIPGADYATSLHGSCSFEAEHAPDQIVGGGSAGDTALVSYTESYSVRGNGGPRYAMQEFSSGAPGVYILCDQTPVYASQKGSAVLEGESRSFPTVNAPFFRAPYLDSETIVDSKVVTQMADGAYQCVQEWSYDYKFPGPLFSGTTPTFR